MFTFYSIDKSIQHEIDCYAYYSAMVDLLPAQIYTSLNTKKPTEDIQKMSLRYQLEKALLQSPELFLKLASSRLNSENIGGQASIISYKKAYTIQMNNYSKVSPSPFKFLSSLCRVRAEHSLKNFININNDFIKNLSKEEFTIIAVLAAGKHLIQFCSFLCQEATKKAFSLDQHIFKPIYEDCHYVYGVTPFVYAALTILDLPSNWTEATIERAINLLNLLLKFNVNPHKKFIHGVMSPRKAEELLTTNSPFAFTLAELINNKQYKNRVINSNADAKQINHLNTFIIFLTTILEIEPCQSVSSPTFRLGS